MSSARQSRSAAVDRRDPGAISPGDLEAGRPEVWAPGVVGRQRPWRALVHGLGELLITLGLVLLLFCVYELYVTNLFTARDQSRLGEDLARSWSGQMSVPSSSPQPDAEPPGSPAAGGPVAAVPEPPLGAAYARFYLPRLRGGEPLVVVEGVGVPDLKKGPGHLPASAAPGQVGNLVISGHRTTYGAPFADIDLLRPDDVLVVETRDVWFSYRVVGSSIVLPTAIEVTAPVPGQPGRVPVTAMITLTTCNPKYSARQRLIVSGELVETRPKSVGRPAVLATG